MKSIKYFGLCAVMLLGIGLTTNIKVTPAEAIITGADLRISVVRPTWWAWDGENATWQVLRVANDAASLNDNTIANITYFELGNYTGDTYYTSTGDNRFTEYNTDGIIFYDIPITSISSKYFDLARLSTTDKATATVFHHTAPEAFTEGLNNQIWRIWNDGNGIYRPDGASAESRNMSNGAISAMLYGYLTCSESVSNGYGAFPELNENLNLLGRTFLDTDTVLDYDYETPYTEDRGTGITVKVADKIAAMNALYEASQPTGFLPTSFSDPTKNIWAVVSMTLAALALSLGYLMVSRKLKKN
ncbi:MAG: hypothetical protein WC399_02155 [Bacilli bacterium]|jgi:hypothetical protein